MASPDHESADLTERLDRINKLTEQLFKAQAHSRDARALADRIHSEIRAARAALESVDRQRQQTI